MTNIQTLSVDQLRKAIDLREQIEALEKQLERLVSGPHSGRPIGSTGNRKLSALARARISRGMKAKWAARKGLGGKRSPGRPRLESILLTNKPVKKRKMSAAGRAAIVAAQKARWAKVKAAKK